MHSPLAYIIAAGTGLLIAHWISRAPELRTMRLSQLIFVPVGMALCVYFLPEQGGSVAGDIGQFMGFIAVLGFLIVLLIPNIAYIFGASLSNFLDPQDWTSLEEEIALRPIRRLIDKDQFNQALADLDELLKTHKPTYEALLIKAKLLYNLGSVDETVATLLNLIPMSHTTAQQLAVLELLAVLEGQHQEPPNPIVSGTRYIEINHDLVLFQIDDNGDASPTHKEIPPGNYKVEEILHRNHRWLQLAGENWGNAEMCWEAVVTDRASLAPQKNGFLRRIARTHEAVTSALKRKPRLQRQAEARQLFQEATQHIRRNDWRRAVPLLQKASACDPDHFDIAYRWAQAVRFTSIGDEIEQTVAQVLRQSRWTDHEEQMIRELQRPVSR
jgi:tetratricopeptide (TPR) repeat protein